METRPFLAVIDDRSLVKIEADDIAPAGAGLDRFGGPPSETATEIEVTRIVPVPNGGMEPMVRIHFPPAMSQQRISNTVSRARGRRPVGPMPNCRRSGRRSALASTAGLRTKSIAPADAASPSDIGCRGRDPASRCRQHTASRFLQSRNAGIAVRRRMRHLRGVDGRRFGPWTLCALPCGRAAKALPAKEKQARGTRRAQADRGRGEILLEMRYRGGPGNWQHGGGTLQ